MNTTLDFILFLLADLAFFFGLVWSWRGGWAPGVNPQTTGPAWGWGWPIYAGLLCFTLPWLIGAAQHLH